MGLEKPLRIFVELGKYTLREELKVRGHIKFCYQDQELLGKRPGTDSRLV